MICDANSRAYKTTVPDLPRSSTLHANYNKSSPL